MGQQLSSLITEDPASRSSKQSMFQFECAQRSNLIVFDWDDTLFPTQKVKEMQSLQFDEDRIRCEHELSELSHLIYKVLSEYIQRYKAHNVRIVSSSQKGWVQESLLMVSHIGCFKSIYHLIIEHRIQLIHPLNSYLPWSTRKKVLVWKCKVFRSLLKDCYPSTDSAPTDAINTFISIGDSVYEFEASKWAAKAFEDLFVHRIKFIKHPSIKDMMDEMNLLLKFCGMYEQWLQLSSLQKKTNMTIVYGQQ